MKRPHGSPPPAARPPRRDSAESLAQRFNDVRATTLALAEPLSAEDCALQSMPDASPVKWHMAHTTWFFETFIVASMVPDYKPFHPHFRILFNSYYNAVGDKHPRPERGLVSRPGLQEVLAYRDHVDQQMQEYLSQGTGLTADAAALVELGLNHEQQHQELILTDLKHLFSRNPLHPVYRKRWPLTTIHPRQRTWIR